MRSGVDAVSIDGIRNVSSLGNVNLGVDTEMFALCGMEDVGFVGADDVRTLKVNGKIRDKVIW